MFILGLFLGPILGLLGGDALRTRLKRPWESIIIATFVLLALPLIPWGDLELRLGLAAGMLLGLLLSITPESMESETA